MVRLTHALPAITYLFSILVPVVAQDRAVTPDDVVAETGATDLMWVAANRPVEELRDLIANEPDIDPAARDDYGNTALHWVAFYATDPAVLDILLDLGVPTDVRNEQGFTAFEIIQANEALVSTDPYQRLLRIKLESR